MSDACRLLAVLCFACQADRHPTDSHSPADSGSGPTTGETGTPPKLVDPISLLGEIVCLPGGTFLMGDVKGDPYATFSTVPQHQVTVSAFCVAERELTIARYLAVTGQTLDDVGPQGCEDPECPVTYIDHAIAEEYAARVRELTGEAWRLPTEAEWEYAAHGGEDYVYAGSNDALLVGWIDENSDAPHPGCELQRNGFGLCDMTGNVSELCADYLTPYSADPQVDPLVDEPSDLWGNFRVIRGGNFRSPAVPYARLTRRSGILPVARAGAQVGIRLARSDP